MELRLCPKCRRAFFARKFSKYVKCNFCGFVLSDGIIKKQLASSISRLGSSFR